MLSLSQLSTPSVIFGVKIWGGVFLQLVMGVGGLGLCPVGDYITFLYGGYVSCTRSAELACYSHSGVLF